MTSKEFIQKLVGDCKGDCLIMEVVTFTTAAYYPVFYCKNGININPDRNRTTTEYNCKNCNRRWRHIHQGGDSEIVEL